MCHERMIMIWLINVWILWLKVLGSKVDQRTWKKEVEGI